MQTDLETCNKQVQQSRQQLGVKEKERERERDGFDHSFRRELASRYKEREREVAGMKKRGEKENVARSRRIKTSSSLGSGFKISVCHSL